MPICIDWKFIGVDLEGGRALKGYVPTDDPKKPGVTIASGVDLGARSASEIKRLPIMTSLKETLIPYAGLKGQAARNFLRKHPLKITEAEAKSLDSAIRTSEFEVVGRLIKKYDEAVKNKPGKVPFRLIPCEAQTVIVSVAYQHGDDLRRHDVAPKFWGVVTDQDWEGAVAELRNFNDDFTPRRRREADYLERYIARESIEFFPKTEEWRKRAIQP